MKKKITNFSKKSFLIMFCILLFLSGCNNKEINIDDLESIEDSLSFDDFSDSKLQDYMLESLYSNIDSSLDSDDYTIENISSIYISKEYLEEMEYNSKSNIYFGYTLLDLEDMFQGKKYVFTVGEDNKITAVEFTEYKNTYNKMIKDVMIGSGVILFCATISVTTGGQFAAVMAFAANQGLKVGLSSGAFSGVVATSIEYYNTGDISQALEKGAQEAANGFKWGAIIGAVSGGIYENAKQNDVAKALKTMDFKERGKFSEARALKKYGGESQVSFLNKKKVSLGTKGATRPDIIRKKLFGKKEAIEVKNSDLNCKECRKALVAKIKKEVTDRVNNLPDGYLQRIVIDISGKNYSKRLLKGVKKGIQNACKDVYKDLPVDFMY